MGINTYTKTENGGLEVEPKASEIENAVEIRDQETGRVYDSITGITDLRDAKSVADSGEKIFVYPGEYETRNLIKDKVDWHFFEGAEVTRTPGEAGAIFEAVGAHGSPGSAITTNVTGKGTFIVGPNTGGSGDAVTNISYENSEFSMTAKEFRATGDAGAIRTFVFGGSAQQTVDVDLVKIDTPSGSENVVLVDDETSSVSASETESAEIVVNVGEFDYSDAEGESSLYRHDFSPPEPYRGITEIDVKKLRSSGNNEFDLAFNASGETKGYIRLSIRDHVEGRVNYGFDYFDGSKPVLLDDFNIRQADQTPTTTPSYSLGFDNTTSTVPLYVHNSTFEYPEADAASNKYTAKPLDGSSATPTFNVVGDVAFTNGANAFDPDVSTVGSDVDTL